MNASSRLPWAAVCLLLALMPAVRVSAQPFLGGDIVGAQQINAEARQRMGEVVNKATDDLVNGDAAAITAARKTLLGPLENINASPAFLDAFSEMISAKLDPAVNHKDKKTSVLVRMNAMIIASRLTDEGSMAHIATALEDDNVAVQHWAMKGLERRVTMWQARAEKDKDLNIKPKLDAILKQVVAKLEMRPAPHPIVVGPGLNALLEIGTKESYQALIDQLNSRVAMHAADPDLSYSSEQSVIQKFALAIGLDRALNNQFGTDMNRAAFRYATLILSHAKANKIGQDQQDGALSMLNQSILAMGQVTAGAGASTKAPQNQLQANAAIVNQRWADLEKLMSDWAVILRAAPFNLTNEQLGL